MNKGGGISSSQSLQDVIRNAALIVSVLIAVYTAAFTSGIIISPSLNESVFYGYAFAIVWLLSGIIQYFSYKDTELNILLRISWYQLLAALYLTFITGIASFPFVACWMIMAIATYSYYEIKGYVISVVVFWLATLSHSFLFSVNASMFTNNINTAISITVTMTVLLYFFRIQERDDQEFQQAQREEELQRTSLLTLVNNLTDAIISTDETGKVRLYNAATVNLLDTNSKLDGDSIDNILKLQEHDGTPVSFEKLLFNTQKLTVNESLSASIGGELVRMELTYSPIRSSNNDTVDDSYIIIMRDITKSKSLEEERDEFISVVSHELRTPIAIAEGSIDNARVIFDKDPSKVDVVSKTLSLAHEQVIFLAKMVNDLSTLSRAERGVGNESEIIDVDELAHAMHVEYAPEAEAKGLKLNLSTKGKLGSVKTSRLYLQELLQNFVTNSIKYTKEGHVDIIIEQRSKAIHFAVKDSGIGISRADQQKIFQKFYRSEDYRTRETGGTGLGLYVAAKLAKKIDCKIKVVSRLNHGSTFSFDLPAHKEEKVSKTLTK